MRHCKNLLKRRHYSLPYEDEGRIDEEDVCTEEEFSLRPRLRRDLPLRRSTR